MESQANDKKAYTGIDRRSSAERRTGIDRRDLFRYESIGSDRRTTYCRRNEDVFWRKPENQINFNQLSITD